MVITAQPAEFVEFLEPSVKRRVALFRLESHALTLAAAVFLLPSGIVTLTRGRKWVRSVILSSLVFDGIISLIRAAIHLSPTPLDSGFRKQEIRMHLLGCCLSLWRSRRLYFLDVWSRSRSHGERTALCRRRSNLIHWDRLAIALASLL